MYTVYAIASKTLNYIYVGMTTDFDNQLFRHNSGLEKVTKAYGPFLLIYSETHDSRGEAHKRGKFLKTTKGKDFLRGIRELEFKSAGINIDL